MYLKLNGLDIMDCINVAQDRDKWQVLMNVAMKVSVP